MKDTRRDYEKYAKTPYSGKAIKILCPNIAELLNSLESALSPTEVLDVSFWTNDWFYIIVEETKDKEKASSCGSSKCGFTVNIKRDSIMWNDSTEDNFSGGNCFLRSVKWKRWVNKRWNKEITDKQMSFYKP